MERSGLQINGILNKLKKCTCIIKNYVNSSVMLVLYRNQYQFSFLCVFGLSFNLFMISYDGDYLE